MPKLFCQETTIVSGAHAFPIYIGFMNAADILAVAEAPSFNTNTLNSEIAKNATSHPVRQWQRPLDDVRVHNIASLFDNTGEFMPNPVLLAENVTVMPSTISINTAMAFGQTQMPLYEVDIPMPQPRQEKPLWILDGQHRINGMGQSKQANNQIPVVLLLNRGGANYNGSALAKIFAQVTTQAKGLDPLHNEWLTFAFNLGDYDPSNPQQSEHKRAMECVAHLCMQQTVSGGAINNAFWDRVQFCHFRQGPPPPGGFEYTCGDLKKLVWDYYYHAPAGVGVVRIAPPDLAEQLALAHKALTGLVTAPLANTVFFGTGKSGHKIMQDAFLAGVMTLILHHGVPHSWDQELKQLKFDQTDWNFSWVKSLSGPISTLSKNLAIRVFQEAFQSRSLPPGSSNLADFLRGNNASIRLEFSELSPTGRLKAQNKDFVDLTRGMATSTNIAPRVHIKLASKTGNIGKVEFIDNQSTPGRPVYYQQIAGQGLNLTSNISNPLRLRVMLYHYGGNDSYIDIDINW